MSDQQFQQLISAMNNHQLEMLRGHLRPLDAPNMQEINLVELQSYNRAQRELIPPNIQELVNA